MYGKSNAVYRANNNKIGANNDAANQSKKMRHSITLRMSKKSKRERNAANDNAKHRRLSETDGDTDKEESRETIESAQCFNHWDHLSTTASNYPC